MTALSPRCGRPMRRYETPGRPVLEDPVCGSPAGHKGDCRSQDALRRAAQSKKGRGEAQLEARRERYWRWRKAGYPYKEAARRMDWAELPEAEAA